MYFPYVLLGVFLALTHAHMMLDYPAAFNASNNPHRKSRADPYLEFPYDKAGPLARWTYPCRGYEGLLGTSEGAPTAIWEAGSIANFNISGIGNHFGGSCQVGFSIDGGKTFRVATSYEGNCPHRDNGNGPDGQNFDFKVPNDIESGVHIFAWIWYNREQEFNMNCAAVQITSPGEAAPPTPAYATATTVHGRAINTEVTPAVYKNPDGCFCRCGLDGDSRTCTCFNESCPTNGAPFLGMKPRDIANFMAFNDRPLMFVADDGNDCLTPHTTAELKYPDPGPDVVQGDGAYPLELPSGDCSPTQMLAKQAFAGQ